MACMVKMVKAARLLRKPAIENMAPIKYGYTGGIQAVGPLGIPNGELKPWCVAMEVAIFTTSGPPLQIGAFGVIGQRCTTARLAMRTSRAIKNIANTG